MSSGTGFLIRFLGAGLILLAASAQAASGSVEMRLRALESRIPDADRLAVIERSMGGQGAGVVADEVDQLKSEVRELRGQIEQLTHELQKQQQSQRQLYNDIDRRLQGMEARSAGGTETPATGAPLAATEPDDGVPGAPAAGNEQADYLAAFDTLQLGKTAEAIPAFERFLDRYPNSRYASNAVYWLGEANYVSKNYPQATAEFQKLIAQYPESSKVSGALLKLGYIHYETRDFAQAREVLENVKSRYPDTNVGTLAIERLERMRKEGV